MFQSEARDAQTSHMRAQAARSIGDLRMMVSSSATMRAGTPAAEPIFLFQRFLRRASSLHPKQVTRRRSKAVTARRQCVSDRRLVSAPRLADGDSIPVGSVQVDVHRRAESRLDRTKPQVER